MVSTASVLGALHLGEVVENKKVSSFVVSYGEALNECSHLYVEDRWPRHLGNGNYQSCAEVLSKRQRYNSLSREWRINKANKKKTPVTAQVLGKDFFGVNRDFERLFRQGAKREAHVLQKGELEAAVLLA